jgi:hypothetical protein
MDLRRTTPPFGKSAGRWDDEPEGPPRHPQELDSPATSGRSAKPGSAQRGDALVAAVQARLARLDATVRPQVTAFGGRVQSSLQAWLGRDARAAAGASLATLSPLAFARYLVVFLAGVVATVVWQQSRGSEPRPQPVAAIPADIAQVRESLERLTVEVSRMRTVELGILDRVSTPPPPPASPPAAVPARNTQRPPPVR